MSFVPVYYRVQIDGSTYATLTANQDGFMDPTTPTNYDPMPSTQALGLAKSKANVRWNMMMSFLGERATPIYILDVVATGASGDDAPTELDFTVVYERPESVETVDETIPFVQRGVDPVAEPGSYLYGADAVKRWVARAIMFATPSIGFNADVFDPTATHPWYPTTKPSTPRDPQEILNIKMAALDTSIASAEGKVTVTEIVGTF